MELSDRAAKDFIIALDKVRNDIVAKFISLKDTATADEIRRMIVMETKDFVFTDPKFSAAFNKMLGMFGESLDGIKAFAAVSETTLQGLIDIQQASWVAEFEIEITAIQKEIFNASLSGSWNQKTIINNLINGVHGNLTEGQINTLVDTSLSTFERNITTAMMEEMPDDTLYIYVGPQDDKTREICNEMLGAGAITKQEIIGAFGSDALGIGGGINCRHKWTLSDIKGQSEEFDI